MIVAIARVSLNVILPIQTKSVKVSHQMENVRNLNSVLRGTLKIANTGREIPGDALGEMSANTCTF